MVYGCGISVRVCIWKKIMDQSFEGKPVVLFDGWCRLCSSFAGWLIRRDKKGKLLLAPLQGETAGKLLAGFGYESPPEDSIILIQGKKLFLRSTAVLSIMKILGAPWSWFYPLIYIPRTLRDFVYRLVAAVRYRVLGRRGSCRVPGEDEKGRMLP